MNSKLLIVLPCYNEEQALPLLLRDLQSLPHIEGVTITPVVVNDCSKDNTGRIAAEHGVKVLNLINNLGIGGAVQTGIRYAMENGYDYMVQMDGDGQHPPGELHKLVEAALNTNADMVIGSRFLTRSGFQSTFVRRLGIKYFYFLNRLLTGNSIYDSTSGFRLLGKKAIALACRYYPDDYPEPESLVFFSKAGLKVVEVPVVMNERLGGTSSIGAFASLYYWVKVTMAMLYSYVRKQELQ